MEPAVWHTCFLVFVAPKSKGSSSHGTRMLTWPSQLDHTTWAIGSAGVAWFHLAVFFIYLFNILSTAMSGSTLPDGAGRRWTLMGGSIVITSCLVTMGEYYSSPSQPYQLTSLQEWSRTYLPSSTWGTSRALTLTTSPMSSKTPELPMP